MIDKPPWPKECTPGPVKDHGSKNKVGGVSREIAQLYPLASTHGHNCVCTPHKHTHKNLSQYLTLHHIIKTVFFLYRKYEEKYITKNFILRPER